MAENERTEEQSVDSTAVENQSPEAEPTRSSALPARLVDLLDNVLPVLSDEFGDDRIRHSHHRDELTVVVSSDDLHDVIRFCKEDARLGFTMLKDILCVDWFRRQDRFQINYNLWSLEHRRRLRVATLLPEKEPTIATITDIYSGANWYEREVYDMHGIIFEGHPDLRRMYMPEDFVDPESGEPLYPLRKDFPVMGVQGSLPLPDRDAAPE